MSDAPTLRLPEGWVVPVTATPKDLANCRSCGTLILWVITAKGKRAPYNRDGISHFATCPQSKDWRKTPAKRAEQLPRIRECPSCHKAHAVGTTCDQRPTPYELWTQAAGDRAEYRRLMIVHRHLVPRHICPDCGGDGDEVGGHACPGQ